jgi:hypothetical protein
MSFIKGGGLLVHRLGVVEATVDLVDQTQVIVEGS